MDLLMQQYRLVLGWLRLFFVNHSRWVVALTAVSVGVTACVTEYQPDVVSLPPALVVEGQITNQPGPYTVKLTRTADYSYKAVNLLETGAVVSIEDNLGNRETLQERAPGGTYQTRAGGIQGVAGRSYKLVIQTKSGRRYVSDAELLRAAPPVDRAYSEYRADPLALTTGGSSGWDVYIDTKDPAESGNFYRYEWTHFTSLTVCSTVTEDQRTGALHDLPCCTPCWDITRCYDCLNINSDANVNGKAISRQFITRVPFTGKDPYNLEIEQQAISAGAYQFWKSVRQLTRANGGLFDAAPAAVQGNIQCVSDPNQPVYGYFGATGLTVVPLRVDRRDGRGVPDYQRPAVFRFPPDPCYACEAGPFRTPVKPRYWAY